MQITDIFEPRHEPARSIYLAFQNEATKRHGRTVDEWTKAEAQAVFQATQDAAWRSGVPAPTMQDVLFAEAYARGSADYGAKWAYALTDRMHALSGVDRAKSFRTFNQASRCTVADAGHPQSGSGVSPISAARLVETIQAST